MAREGADARIAPAPNRESERPARSAGRGGVAIALAVFMEDRHTTGAASL